MECKIVLDFGVVLECKVDQDFGGLFWNARCIKILRVVLKCKMDQDFVVILEMQDGSRFWGCFGMQDASRFLGLFWNARWIYTQKNN